MKSVLDASAALAVLLDEPGQDLVATAIAAGSVMSTFNFAEVASRYARAGASESELRTLRPLLHTTLIDGDEGLAIDAALIGKRLPRAGLSLGDRLCLALARREKLPALTADRAWSSHASALGVEVALIR